jgi:benzoylformate decarboxylase
MDPETDTPATRWTRDYLFDALRDLGIRHIFGVPGTNEIPLIDGTSYPENGVEYIECLHENIAMGAAMGSARMTGTPGVVVVHVTPGIAHGIGNLFNACRSRTPLVILCCQQQNDLVTQEPLLASNLVQLAQQYTKWAHEMRTPEEFPLVLQRAFKEAMAPPNGPVFISIPWEFSMRRIGLEDRLPGITRVSPTFTGDPVAIEQAARLLAEAVNPLIVAGDAVGYAGAWPEVQELAELIGAPVVLQTFSSVANFPNDDYHWQGELPGSQAGMQQVFAGHDVAFFCGIGLTAQLAVFKYADGPLIPPRVRQVVLTNDTWDIAKNDFAECAIFGDIKATVPRITDVVRPTPPPDAVARNTDVVDRRAPRHRGAMHHHEQPRVPHAPVGLAAGRGRLWFCPWLRVATENPRSGLSASRTPDAGLPRPGTGLRPSGRRDRRRPWKRRGRRGSRHRSRPVQRPVVHSRHAHGTNHADAADGGRSWGHHTTDACDGAVHLAAPSRHGPPHGSRPGRLT